jgi:DNA polymerase-3 subunit epsilon
MKTLLMYDTETTGLPNWKTPSGGDDQPHMVQIGALLVNAETKEIIKELDVIIKPDGWVIPQETIDVHGITNEHAAEVGIPEKEAIQMLLDMHTSYLGCERVAYNKTFDQRIVRIGLKRFFDEPTQEKWAIKEDHHCAMRMAQKAAGIKSLKLVDAYKHFTGEEMEGAHNAMADTKGCMTVYFACLEQASK